MILLLAVGAAVALAEPTSTPVPTPACEARIEALEKRLKKVESDVSDNEDEIDRLQGMVENAELGF